MGRRRTGASLPAWRSDDAAITRQLRSDSEALRYAEWWVRRRLYGLSDQEARWLHAQYVASYRVMQAALAEALADERGPLTARRARLLGQIEAEMDRLTREVGAHLLDTSVQAYQQGAAGRAWALDMATNPDVGIHTALLPTEAIRAAILTPYLGQQWGDTLALERDEFVLRIKRSLTASLVQGEGMAQAQRRLRDELGIQTDRRKGFKRNFYRTLLIARTEIMRASNLGALAVYEQNQDVLSGWEWVATRDERTCFPAWVKVETADGPRAIASLKPGDLVLTRAGYRPVLNVMRRQYSGRMVRVEAGKHQVVATADHLFWANGWKAAGTLTTLDTLQTFGNKPVKVRGVFDVLLSDANNAPSLLGKQSIAARIFGGILMPVISVNLKGNRVVGQRKINRAPTNLELLSERNAEAGQTFADSGLKHRFSGKRAIAPEAAKLARRSARIGSELLAAMAASNVARGAAALFRTIVSVGVSCGERLATSGARFVKRVDGATSEAANGVSFSVDRLNRELVTAYRTRLSDVLRGARRVIALTGAETLIRLAMRPLELTAAVFACGNVMGSTSDTLPSVVTGARTVLGFSPIADEVNATGGANLIVSHAPIISRVDTHYKKWVWVYDIEVEGQHEFYADGLLVHNCPTCGALDGKRYAFGDPVLAPPSGSHPGCRCTAVPVLRDTDLMDRVAGVRETYAEWAAQNGIDWQQDGALGGQRTSDAHGLNVTSE